MAPAVRPRGALSTIVRAAPGSLVLLTVVSLVAGSTCAAAALALQSFVDGLVGGLEPGRLAGPAALFAGAALIASAAPGLTNYLTARSGRTARLATTARLYERVGAEAGIERLEQPAYQDSLHLAAAAADTAPTLLLSATLGCVQAAVTAAGLAWVMAAAQPLVALVALAGSIPVLLVEARIARRRVAVRAALVPLERRKQTYQSLILNPLAGKEIRLFGLSGFFGGRLVRDLRTANGREEAIDRTSLLAALGLAAGQIVLTVAVLGLILRGALTGATTAGELTALLTAFGALSGAMQGFIGGSVHIREALALLRAYDDVVAEPAAARTASMAVPALTGAITLHDVWFRYDENLPWVLRGVDLVIPADRSTALVGLNGSGKSTVVKLICGLYRPTRGQICWDGVDLADADPDALRSRIGAVFQDYMAYDLTAHENVAVGSVDRLDDRTAVHHAAQAAGVARQLAELPCGYDTMLSRLLYRDPAEPETADPQVVLSGGQWQRVALARMLMRHDRDLLILDEPSAGLDAIAEHEVHLSVQETMRGRARLLISHRLAAVRIADQIAVLAGGRITELGDHTALMRAEGQYAQQFRLQAAGYTDVPDENSREVYT